MLGQPQEILDLHRMQSKPVAVTCLDFPHSDVNNFVVSIMTSVSWFGLSLWASRLVVKRVLLMLHAGMVRKQVLLIRTMDIKDQSLA